MDNFLRSIAKKFLLLFEPASHSVDDAALFGGSYDIFKDENARANLLKTWQSDFEDLMDRNGHNYKHPAGGHRIKHNKELKAAIVEISRSYIEKCHPDKYPHVKDEEFAALNESSMTILKNIIGSTSYRLGDDEVREVMKKYLKKEVRDFDIGLARQAVIYALSKEILGGIIKRSIDSMETSFSIETRPYVSHRGVMPKREIIVQFKQAEDSLGR